jgi:small subunit ribosomal protein S20
LAHSKSAKKAIRQSAKRAVRNKAIRTFFRERIKECRVAIGSGNKESAGAALKAATSAVGKAVIKGVLDKNTGSRYISRLTIQYNKLAAK